jgi:hypothetical protein
MLVMLCTSFMERFTNHNFEIRIINFVVLNNFFVIKDTEHLLCEE